MADKPTPTDAELKAMWQQHAADIGGIFSYAHAVLAKWGQPAQAGAVPLTRDQVKAILVESGYYDADAQHKSHFMNGIRHGEAAHGIKHGGQHGTLSDRDCRHGRQIGKCADCALDHMEMAADAEARRVDELTALRKQDTELIRQMLDALEAVDDAMPFPVARQVLKVARARLEGKP